MMGLGRKKKKETPPAEPTTPSEPAPVWQARVCYSDDRASIIISRRGWGHAFALMPGEWPTLRMLHRLRSPPVERALRLRMAGRMTQLTDRQRGLCERTMSTTAFYYLVLDALERRGSLSVVRMGDGERYLLSGGTGSDLVTAPSGHGDDWLARLGLSGITWDGVQARLQYAAAMCDYFAPSVTGLVDSRFDLYDLVPNADVYVDNFFVNLWTDDQKRALLQAAGHVLFIHGNAHTADAFQLRLQGHLGVKVDFLKLTLWDEATDVIEQAKANTAPLVLFSAGPASKWIGPAIARDNERPRVTLDLGNAADHWTFSSMGPVDRPAAEAFAAEWRRTHA